MVKLVYRLGPRMMRRLTGCEPLIGSGIQPIEVWAHRPKLMMAMGKFNGAVRKPGALEERIRNLCELKGAAMIGCEFCLDLGSQICRNSGFTDNELLAIPRYNSSELFDQRETVALNYTVAVMRTPVEVTDQLFAKLQEHFTTEQIIELTALLTLVNLDRFNAAFAIGPAGYSQGMVCVPPERQQHRN